MEVAAARTAGAMKDAPANTRSGEPEALTAQDGFTARYGWVIALVVGVVVISLAVIAGVLGVSVWKARDAATQRANAEQAARQTAVNLASLDYHNAKQGIDRVLSGMTGDVKNQWATQSTTIADTATKNQATSSVQSVRAGVVSVDGDSAEVIVAMTAITTSPKVKQGAPRYYRFSMDLTRTDGRWLVSKLGLVP